jgi:hypothetical protein
MRYRSLVFAVAALSSLPVASAGAQSVYVAPGGVYIGAGPVYVTPAPNLAPGPYAAPTYGYEYGPAPVAPPPAVVAPTTVYGPNGGYYDAPLSAYAAELPPRPPLAVPYNGGTRCVIRSDGYGRRWQSCY